MGVTVFDDIDVDDPKMGLTFPHHKTSSKIEGRQQNITRSSNQIPTRGQPQVVDTSSTVFLVRL